MRGYTPTHPRHVPLAPVSQAPVLQALFSLAGGAALFMAVLGSLLLGYQYANSGVIYQGVSVSGLDLSGLPPAEASSLLAKHLAFAERGQIVFQEGTNVWIARPAELGLMLDAQSSAMQAYTVGRNGGIFPRIFTQFEAWYFGKDLSPRLVYDERVAEKYLKGIAEQIDRPLVEASLGVEGIDVVVRSGQIGRTMDVEAALNSLRGQMQLLSDGMIPLTVHETAPVILDVEEQAEVARRILSAPLTLQVPEAGEDDPGPWTFDQQTLAGMLTIARVEEEAGARYQVGLDTANLRTFLLEIAPSLARSPQDARFIFNDETRQLEVIQPSVTGRTLDLEESLRLINEKLANGDHDILLDIEYTPPAVADDATAEQLGITGLVSSHTSYFRGSGSSRVQNIQTASARFHGVMIPPGETFSMAEVLGDVSLDNGYSEALIIFGGRTIKGVGGGVCQVSTTLFRTVFFGGYPIVERYPHAYRVGYYEQTSSGGYDPDLAGLDATVFVPVVDFKFRNDTPHWLLMETYVNPSASTLTWKFYSTPDGRSMTYQSTGPENVIEPPEPLYEENPELARGEIKQVDWEAQGADVRVTRVVSRDGQIIYEDNIFTRYMPWRSVYQYGPGTENIPNPEPTEEP